MRKMGLTGNSGSGKSLVSSILKDFGGFIIDADNINHMLMKKGNSSYNEIIKEFGTDILDESAEINREKLGAIVFSDENKLKCLEEITHKHIGIETHKQMEKAMKLTDIYKFIVIDAPLLIEAQMHKDVDETWVVYADENTRLKRIKKRDNIDEERILHRFKAQSSFDFQKKHAHVIINNNESIDKLKEQVKTHITVFLEEV